MHAVRVVAQRRLPVLGEQERAVVGQLGEITGLALAAASTDADRVVFALGVATMPLLAPQAYSYYLTALVLAVVVMLEVEFAVDGRPWLPLLAINALLAGTFYAVGMAMVGSGRVRSRTRAILALW